MDLPIIPDLGTFVLQALNVFIIWAVLYYFLYRPIGGILEARRKKIEGDLSQAAGARAEAQRLLEEYRSQMARARAEAEEILNRARAEGERLREERRKAAEAEADAMIRRARQEIAQETERAVAGLRAEAASLAIAVAEKVLERELDDDQHHKLAQQFVSQLARGSNGSGGGGAVAGGR